MPDKPTGTTFCSICYHAETIAKSAHAAYWLEGADASEVFDVQCREIRRSLAEIVKLFGLELVEAKRIELV